MIALDTNVLVRLLVHDDEPQRRSAERLVQDAAQGAGVYLSDVVLAELGWVLGSSYGYTRTEIGGAIDALVEAREVSFRSLDSVVRALEHYRDGAADLSDYLIAEAASDAGCCAVASFDVKLQGHPLMSHPDEL